MSKHFTDIFQRWLVVVELLCSHKYNKTIEILFLIRAVAFE
jgi:hypothetical protein